MPWATKIATRRFVGSVRDSVPGAATEYCVGVSVFCGGDCDVVCPLSFPSSSVSLRLNPAAAASATSAAAGSATARARARRHAARRRGRHAADAVREARDVERTAATGVPLRRLAIDVLERVCPFLLDAERHRERQILLEELRRSDHLLVAILFDATQKFLEAERRLEGLGALDGAGGHDRGKERHRDNAQHGRNDERRRR